VCTYIGKKPIIERCGNSSRVLNVVEKIKEDNQNVGKIG
jgi:hypothetical protein